MVVISTRQSSNSAQLETIKDLEDSGTKGKSTFVKTIGLRPFSKEECGDFIATKLAVRTARLDPQVVNLLFAKTQGHPFYTEETLYALWQKELITVGSGEGAATMQGDDEHVVSGGSGGGDGGGVRGGEDKASRSARIKPQPKTDKGLVSGSADSAPGNYDAKFSPKIKELESLPLPDSVHRAVLARVDMLSPSQQMLVKTGCVVGRPFNITALRRIHPGLVVLNKEDLVADLLYLIKVRIVDFKRTGDGSFHGLSHTHSKSKREAERKKLRNSLKSRELTHGECCGRGNEGALQVVNVQRKHLMPPARLEIVKLETEVSHRDQPPSQQTLSTSTSSTSRKPQSRRLCTT